MLSHEVGGKPGLVPSAQSPQPDTEASPRQPPSCLCGDRLTCLPVPRCVPVLTALSGTSAPSLPLSDPLSESRHLQDCAIDGSWGGAARRFCRA